MSQVGYQNLPILTVAFQTQFNTVLQSLFEQEGSILRDCVTEVPLSLGQYEWNQIGSVVAEWKDTRHADTTYQEPEFSKRRIQPRDAFAALILDREDQWRSLSDYQIAYVREVAKGLGRKMDEAIISGVLGTNYGGPSGSQALTLPASQYLDVHFQAGGNSATPLPLTTEKISKAGAILNAGFVPMQDRVCLMSSNQMYNLIQEKNVADANYNIVRGAYQGSIDNWAGFKIKVTEYIPRDANGNEQVIFLSRPHVLFGVRKPISTRISELPTKHYAIQVYGDMSIATACRTQETAVVVASCAS
jgi:hypothetical protein